MMCYMMSCYKHFWHGCRLARVQRVHCLQEVAVDSFDDAGVTHI